MVIVHIKSLDTYIIVHVHLGALPQNTIVHFKRLGSQGFHKEIKLQKAVNRT